MCSSIYAAHAGTMRASNFMKLNIHKHKIKLHNLSRSGGKLVLEE